jgi:hypothetical protein
MPRSAALLAEAALLVVSPLAAQAGLGSVSQSVELTATRLSSVSVALADGPSAGLTATLAIGPGQVTMVPVRTSWSVDPASPVGISLAAYFDVPMGAGPRPGGAPAGGPKSLAVEAAEIGSGRLHCPMQPVSAASARGGSSGELQVRIDRIGRSDLSLGTLNLVALTQ